ncbi:MAG: SRPBCC family protein [Planctomycetota bacterium]|jgi:hypothetical protein
MNTVRVSEVLPIDAAQVWAHMRQFGNVEIYEGLVDDCQVFDDGGAQHRVIHLAGGSMHQRLESIDDAVRTLTIRTLETDLPLESHVTTISVTEIGPEECEMTWEATLETPSDADVLASILRDLYLTAIARLKDYLTGTE